MIKSSITINQIKEYVQKMHQKPVDVTLNLGRNKFVKFSGKLVGVYPALFTVLPFDKNFKGKTSYSYSEFMCGRVRVRARVEEKAQNTPKIVEN